MPQGGLSEVAQGSHLNVNAEREVSSISPRPCVGAAQRAKRERWRKSHLRTS